MIRREKIRPGVYRVGRFEVWHEARDYWRLSEPREDGRPVMLGGYRTLAEAVEAARDEQADD
jgi:hypothetical protein